MVRQRSSSRVSCFRKQRRRCGKFRMQNAEFGMKSGSVLFSIPHSAFRIPHSAFRVPHSAFANGPIRSGRINDLRCVHECLSSCLIPEGSQPLAPGRASRTRGCEIPRTPIPEGSQRDIEAPNLRPLRGRKKFPDVSGGVASLNHRLIAAIPPGSRRLALLFPFVAVFVFLFLFTTPGNVWRQTVVACARPGRSPFFTPKVLNPKAQG